MCRRVATDFKIVFLPKLFLANLLQFGKTTKANDSLVQKIRQIFPKYKVQQKKNNSAKPTAAKAMQAWRFRRKFEMECTRKPQSVTHPTRQPTCKDRPFVSMGKRKAASPAKKLTTAYTDTANGSDCLSITCA